MGQLKLGLLLAAAGLSLGLVLSSAFAAWTMYKKADKLTSRLAQREEQLVQYGMRVIAAEKAKKLCEDATMEAKAERDAAQQRVVEILSRPHRIPQEILDRLQQMKQQPCEEAVGNGAQLLHEKLGQGGTP